LVWAEGAQHRLELEGEAPPKKKASRLAMACGFSLPADTAVHAFDRVGLQRLCGDGARGPVSEERLTQLPSWLSRWQPKRRPALTLRAEAPGRPRASARPAPDLLPRRLRAQRTAAPRLFFLHF
jgi:hypothetical protein